MSASGFRLESDAASLPERSSHATCQLCGREVGVVGDSSSGVGPIRRVMGIHGAESHPGEDLLSMFWHGVWRGKGKAPTWWRPDLELDVTGSSYAPAGMLRLRGRVSASGGAGIVRSSRAARKAEAPRVHLEARARAAAGRPAARAPGARGSRASFRKEDARPRGRRGGGRPAEWFREDLLDALLLMHPPSGDGCTLTEAARLLEISPSRLSHRLYEAAHGKMPAWRRKFGWTFWSLIQGSIYLDQHAEHAQVLLRKLERGQLRSRAPGAGIPAARHVKARGGG